MRLKRLVESWYANNDGTRLILESLLVPEVKRALEDWAKNTNCPFVLIGGGALSFHVIPRMTMDIDTLFLVKEDIPEKVNGFKRTRPSAFQHNKTHVEVEVLYADSINISHQLVKQVLDSAVVSNGIKIASKSGLVALKLMANRSGAKGLQDKADIVNLINSGGVDITNYDISPEALEQYQQLCKL